MNIDRYIRVNTIDYSGRKNIDWGEVKKAMKSYQGKSYCIKEYDQEIRINLTSVDEFSSSRYTRRLKGTLAKAKANLIGILPELIANATNRRWVPNNAAKHSNNASKGWYRYDGFFALPVKASDESEIRWNRYRCTLIVNSNDNGLFLYDVINIKKEVSNPR